MNQEKRYVECIYINFGSYPQTVVSNKNLIDKLNELTETNNRDYYELNGKEYIKISVQPHRDSYLFSNKEQIIKGNFYWFEVEPIKWRVLNYFDDIYTLFTTVALDTYIFDDKSNNYKNSDIRQWLNNDFYNVAFNDEEKEMMKIMLIDNSLQSTADKENKYICEDTKDKVTLLSYLDATEPYLFRNNNDDCKTRQIEASDYAKAKGIEYNTYPEFYNKCYWWLRSPNDDSKNSSRVVFYDGSILSGNITDDTTGVCPVITIQKETK